MDEAVTFYEDFLGVTFAVKTPHWSQFHVGDITIGLHPRYSAEATKGGWVLGFTVNSIEEWIAKLDDAKVGHSEIDTLHDGTQMVSFADPDGIRWQAIQPR